MAKSNPLPMQATIAQMKLEILIDIREGRVPITVEDFSQLHDHVDANEYGGFCDEQHRNSSLDAGSDDDAAYVNACQDAVSGWLGRHGHVEALTPEERAAATARIDITGVDHGDCAICDNGKKIPADEQRIYTMEDHSVQVYCRACMRCLQA